MKKNLRYFMTLLLMMVASVGWAEDVTIATATFDGKNATYTEGWTTTGTGLGRTDCVIIGKDENITSPAFDLTGYSSVTITFTARRYGTLTGSKATVDAAIAGNSVGTIDITKSSVGTVDGNITFSPTSSMTAASIVFTCTNATSAGSTHGAGIGTITIVGTKGGTITYDSDLTLSPTTVELDLAGTKTQDLTITTSSTGAITWTSNNPDVATVDNGKVTAVAVGTATITASQAADATYRAGEATCVVNVINSESTEQTVSFVAGTDKGTNGSSGNADTMTKGGITVSGTSLATTTAEYRVYANSTFTISSTVGKIIKIEFTGVSSYPVSRFGEVEGLTTSGNNGTWTGSASSVSFTPSSQVRLSSINVTYERLDETVSASPEISGTTPFLTSTNVTITAAEGASIYYTTDGTDPSESSTVYTGPFAITATTTVKAIAVEQGKSASEISEETFTKTESYTLGEIYSLDAGKYYVNFNNAVVTYVNGSYTFIQDNSGAVLYFKNNGGYTVGQVLNGTAYVDYTVYQGQPEITNITPEEGMTVTDGPAVEPTVVTLASLVDNSTTYISKYVKVEGVEATSTSELSQNGTTLAFYGRNNAAIETGKRYDIIGFLGNHNGTYQLTAYTPDHVQVLADERQDPNISFSVETLEITQGDEFEAPTFSNENNVEVTFSTTNEDVATWDATNGLTLGTATGTATITATFEGNDTYKYATAQLTVTVNAQITPITGDYYEKVTSTSGITNGEYLIVYEDGNVAFNGGLETLDAASNTVAVTISDNKIASTDAVNAATFTIDTTNGTLKSASGMYIGVSSNSNGLKQTDNSSTYTHKFSIDEDGNAVIAAVFDGSTMTLRYNKASDQLRFRYFKSGQQAIQLYKKVSDTPAKVSIKTAASGYTTLVSGEALDIANLPVGLTAYYVAEGGVSTDKDKVTLTQVTAAVPAETPLIFKGAVSTPYEIPIATSGTALSDNQLAGSSTESTTFQNDGDAYILSGGEFHPTKAGTFPAGKAYLNVSAVNAKALTISFAETNGINNVNVKNNTNEKIFNLAGQQMKSAVKGVYIKNGRKYVK